MGKNKKKTELAASGEKLICQNRKVFHNYAIGERLAGNFFRGCVALTPAQGKLRAALYEMGAVKSEDWLAAGGSELDIYLPESDWTRLKQQHGF